MGQFTHLTISDASNAGSYINMQCGYCHKEVSAQLLARSCTTNPIEDFLFLRCPICLKCTSWDYITNKLYPGKTYGKKINGLPEDVDFIFSEIKNCFFYFCLHLL